MGKIDFVKKEKEGKGRPFAWLGGRLNLNEEKNSERQEEIAELVMTALRGEPIGDITIKGAAWVKLIEFVVGKGMFVEKESIKPKQIQKELFSVDTLSLNEYKNK